MRIWRRPSFGGDFRLEAINERTCRLSVHDPTPGELSLLTKLLGEARKKEWTDPVDGIARTGKSELVLQAPVHDVGIVLFPPPDDRPLLTVASFAGQVTVIYDSLSGAPPKEELAAAEEATTISKPRAGKGGDCPDTLASEVLCANCTSQQWGQWEKHGWLVAHGGLTGRRYRVAHRKRHVGEGMLQRTVAVDLDEPSPSYMRNGRGEVNAWDWMYPPAEEVCSIMLTLQHREHWLRNPSFMRRASRSSLFRDPFPELSAADHDFMNNMEHFEAGFNEGGEILSQLLQGVLH